MIIGIGTDIASISRVEKGLARFGERFACRILAPCERELMPGGRRGAAFLAGRWAAKEACAKALGTGFSLGVGPGQIFVLPDGFGAPQLDFLGAAAERAWVMGVTRAHVSISHDAGSAIAFCVLEHLD